MTNDFNAVRPPSARRHMFIVTVFALAAAAGAISYLLMERATVPTPDVQYVAEVDDVQRALRLGKPAVVEFGANACASCREMKPVLESLEREHGERISVLNIDTVG